MDMLTNSADLCCQRDRPVLLAGALPEETVSRHAASHGK
jgi:hypothetical protein